MFRRTCDIWCPEKSPPEKSPRENCPRKYAPRKIAPRTIAPWKIVLLTSINLCHKKLLFRCCGDRRFASEFIRWSFSKILISKPHGSASGKSQVKSVKIAIAVLCKVIACKDIIFNKHIIIYWSIDSNNARNWYTNKWTLVIQLINPLSNWLEQPFTQTACTFH